MSNGHMLVTVGAVETGASDVDAIANQITQELQDLHSFLAPLVSTWEGTASGDWKSLQARWDTSATTLNAVLRQIAVALRTAAANYTSTENANTSIWG